MCASSSTRVDSVTSTDFPDLPRALPYIVHRDCRFAHKDATETSRLRRRISEPPILFLL